MRLISGLALLLFVSGCQCCGYGEAYSDHIDDFAGHAPKLDCLYSACIDLTRIGHSDWCCCSSSRLWCPGACDKSCCRSGGCLGGLAGCLGGGGGGCSDGSCVGGVKKGSCLGGGSGGGNCGCGAAGCTSSECQGCQ